jgi:hypothetical protein
MNVFQTEFCVLTEPEEELEKKDLLIPEFMTFTQRLKGSIIEDKESLHVSDDSNASCKDNTLDLDDFLN